MEGINIGTGVRNEGGRGSRYKAGRAQGMKEKGWKGKKR